MIEKERFTSRMTVDLDAELKTEIENIANNDRRTLSSLIRKLLNDFRENLLIDIPPELKPKLEQIALAEDRPVSYIVRKILQKYCNNYSSENKEP